MYTMATGWYDPTTENETPWEDHRIDHDDADDDDADITPDEEREWHSTPGATSTPYRPGDAYHPGEEHEMTHMPQEQRGMVQGPGEPAWNSLTFIYPDASATDLDAYMDPKSKRLMVRMKGIGKKAYPLYTTRRGTDIQQLNPNLTQEIRKALGESTLDQAAALQRERDMNIQRIAQLTNTKDQLNARAEFLEELKKDLERLRTRIRAFEEEIRWIEDNAGPLDEERIQRLKDEKALLEEEHQKVREQYDQAYAQGQRVLHIQREIRDLWNDNEALETQINKLGVAMKKTVTELEQEKAVLEKRLAENKRVLEDENASPSDIEEARQQVEEDERVLERVNADMEREEQKLPMRERVKNIFKKYGWTLQAVALAVGIVLSALALAATNGLKAGTKALGKGLLAIGKKLGSLLPGLIGSIVSFIFKAAGQVFSFLGEHAWLLILAVVAFFMERLLKKRRK